MSIRERTKRWAKSKIQDWLPDGITDGYADRPGDASTCPPLHYPPSSPNNPGQSEPATFDGQYYNVAGVGAFKNHQEWTFNGSNLPDGLYASDYTVYDSYDSDAPYNHRFDPQNVYTKDSFLNLRVPAYPSGCVNDPQDAISSAEIATTVTNIMYASVRTTAVLSDVPGTCHGMFFYKDDTQECDIEYLTDAAGDSNNIMGANAKQTGSIPLWCSNQALVSGSKATHAVFRPPHDVTAVHEYRIDWTKDFTAFYLDGVLQRKHTTNVPDVPGSWIWNNWANGDKGWSSGPPRRDNVFKIQKIVMYYNTDEDVY